MDPAATVDAIHDALDDGDTKSFDLLFDALVIWLETDGFVPKNLRNLIARMDEHCDLGGYAEALREASVELDV